MQKKVSALVSIFSLMNCLTKVPFYTLWGRAHVLCVILTACNHKISRRVFNCFFLFLVTNTPELNTRLACFITEYNCLFFFCSALVNPSVFIFSINQLSNLLSNNLMGAEGFLIWKKRRSKSLKGTMYWTQ